MIRLSQQSTGYTKILLFFVQIASLMIGRLPRVLTWVTALNFTPQDSSGENCGTPGGRPVLCIRSFVLLGSSHCRRLRFCSDAAGPLL